MITTPFAWHNGKVVPFAEAQTHVAAFALHYGIAVFEGIRCYARADGRGAVFRLREHVARFFESAKICAFEIPFSPTVVEAACAEVMRANQLREAYIRPLAFTGGTALGMGVTTNPVEVAVICWPWGPALGNASGQGIRAQTSSFVRGHLNATMSKGKISGQYVNSVLAKRESQRLGYDEAIMVDAQGRVAEASAMNVFAIYRGQLMTPPLEMPILDGITRDTIITLAREAGIAVAERTFTRDMLWAAEECFLTGTGAEVVPVREVDGRVIGSGGVGAVTKRLMDAFARCTRGPGDEHPEWLTYL